MHRIIYISSETAPFTDAELDELLRKSRRANLAAKITGLLLYQDGQFMQILEGPEPAVLTLFDKIKGDPRHRDLVVLMDMETPNREFQEWSMGFKKLNAETSRELPGYQNLDRVALHATQFLANPSQSLGLLLAFKAAFLKDPPRT